MLPQMMPLPWIIVFLMIFFSFLLFSLFFSSFNLHLDSKFHSSLVFKGVTIPW